MWLVYVLHPDLESEAHLTLFEKEARRIYENAKKQNWAVLAEIVESYPGWQAEE